MPLKSAIVHLQKAQSELQKIDNKPVKPKKTLSQMAGASVPKSAVPKKVKKAKAGIMDKYLEKIIPGTETSSKEKFEAMRAASVKKFPDFYKNRRKLT